MRIHVEVVLDQENRRALKKFFKAFYGEEFAPKNEFHYNEDSDDGVASITLYFDNTPPTKIMASIAGLGKITYHQFDNQGKQTLESNLHSESKESVSETAEAKGLEEIPESLKTEDLVQRNEETKASKIGICGKVHIPAEHSTKAVELPKNEEAEVHIPSDVLAIIENAEHFSDMIQELADALEIPEKMQDFFIFACKTYRQLNGKSTWGNLVNMAKKAEIPYHTYYRDKMSAILKNKTSITLMAFLDVILSGFAKQNEIKDEKVERADEEISTDPAEKRDMQETAENMALEDSPEENSEEIYVELGVIRKILENAQTSGEKVDFEGFLTFEKNLNKIDKSLSLENRISKALYVMKFPERLNQDEKMDWHNSLVKDLSFRLKKAVPDFPAVCDGVNLENRCKLAEVISTTLKSFGIKENIKDSSYLEMLRLIIMTEKELDAIK